MISDEEKKHLIAFGQHIEETLQDETQQYFQYRPSLPGFGDIEGDEFIKYDLGVTFSLSHLVKVNEDNPNASMSQQVGLIFASEIVMTLFHKILLIFDIQTNTIHTDSVEAIVNFGNLHEKSTILCSLEDLWQFEKHKDYEEQNLKEYCGPSEPFPVGKIKMNTIYCNPLQLLSDKSIYLLTKPLIEYGIAINRENVTTYEVKEDDVEVVFNPADIYYRVSADIDSFKTFNLNENEES